MLRLKVSRDCVGQKALVERFLDHRKAEMASAMRAIEDDAVALRFDDLLEDQSLISELCAGPVTSKEFVLDIERRLPTHPVTRMKSW